MAYESAPTGGDTASDTADTAVDATGDIDAASDTADAAGDAERHTADAAGELDPAGGRPATQWAELEALEAWGFHVDDRAERVDDIEGAIAYRESLLAERDALNYEIDGVVIKVDDTAAADALGSTARETRSAFAYKFPARTEVTTITDIVVQVGRTGRLTPVALLDPIDVSGVEVSRATLHNPQQVAELGVGVGDTVRVKRAGDVIPYVESVLDGGEESFEFPDSCPVCESPIEREGPIAFCTGGVGCPAQLRRAIQHYAARSGLDIEGLGEKAVDQLIDAGLIERLPDLYELSADDLVDLDGWGETSAENLLAAIDGSREPELAALLSALGVPNVGRTTAADIARHFGTLDAVVAADEAELRDVDGVGPTVASEIAAFFDSERNLEIIEDLRAAGVDPRPAKPAEESLEGLTFVFTGSIEGLTRSGLRKLIEIHGGSATSSVSGNTDYLVVGEAPGQSKREAAEEHGVPMLDRSEFESLLADHGIEL